MQSVSFLSWWPRPSSTLFSSHNRHYSATQIKKKKKTSLRKRESFCPRAVTRCGFPANFVQTLTFYKSHGRWNSWRVYFCYVGWLAWCFAFKVVNRDETSYCLRNAPCLASRDSWVWVGCESSANQRRPGPASVTLHERPTWAPPETLSCWRSVFSSRCSG